MLSMATVATRPRASLRAEMEPAMSIWDSSQPPKMSPLALVSLGMATVCRASSPLGTGASSWSSSWLMVSSPAVTSRRPIRGEIGRASCREREEGGAGGGAMKRRGADNGGEEQENGKWGGAGGRAGEEG